MKDRVEAVCDLLMGAAFADENLHEKEKQVVENYLKELMPDGKLTPELRERIDTFAPASFEMEKVAKLFASDGKSDRIKLLDVVAAVNSADGEYDFAEDDYLHSVAKAMSLDEDDSKEHTLVYEVETLKGYLATLRPPPPPPAKSK